MDDLSFEWDEEKNASNIVKHGVDFLDAALIFENPTIEDIDDSADYGETRHIAIGLSQETVLRVVFTWRGDTSSELSAHGRRTNVTRKNTSVKYALSDIKKQVARGKSKTRKDAPESEPMGEAFWKRAKIVMPLGKTSVHLRIDSDVFEWFKKQGNGHLTRMNAVLRSFVDAHRQR